MTHRSPLAFALAAALLTAGCSSRAVTVGGDGGSDCASLDEASCRSDSRCVAFAPCCCGGPITCAPAGTQPPVCTVVCPQNRCADPCKGKDEAFCKNSQACIADYCTECSCTPTYVGCRLVASPKTICPALGCPQPNCGCSGLDESACKAAASSMSCTTNYCPDCHGGQTYAGCTGPAEGAPQCGRLCSANSCRQQSDCTNGQICLAPGQPLCGGACMIPPTCATDGECGGGSMICDVPQCGCGGNQKGCIQGCTSTAGCGAGQICDATHRCAPQPCGTCPSQFACANSGCQRKVCKGDVDCGGTGFCVAGQCYDTQGMCSFLPG